LFAILIGWRVQNSFAGDASSCRRYPAKHSQFPDGCLRDNSNPLRPETCASAAISILRSARISAICFARLVLAVCLPRRLSGRNGAFCPIACPPICSRPNEVSRDKLRTASAGGSHQKDFDQRCSLVIQTKDRLKASSAIGGDQD
jgi:hypothetical protein